MNLRKNLNLRMAILALIAKLMVLVFGYQSYVINTDQPIGNFFKVFYIWKQWDAIHYINIAQNGYTAIGEDRFLIVFYPLYPLLTAVFDFAIGDTVISAFLLSAVCSVALAVLFRELVRLDFNERVAQTAVLFLFIFPTSYVLHIPYTESLFLSLTIATFLAARKKYWILAGVLGFFACTSRINGLILLPALMFEVWGEYRETKKINKRWFFLLLIPFGIALYLALNQYVSGNMFQFLEYQREHWHRYLRMPWYSIADAVRNTFNRSPSQAMMVGFQELFFVAIGLAGIIFGWTKLRASYRVWMVANWLLFISTSFVLSVPRYTIVLFPLFIVISIYASKEWLFKILVTMWSLMFLALFSAQFVQGKWAF